MDVGRRVGEIVAPVARGVRREQAAWRLVRAGRDDAEVTAQLLAHRDERTAGGVRAGFHPNDGIGAARKSEQFGEGGRREFVDDVAQDKCECGLRRDFGVRRAECGRSRLIRGMTDVTRR